MTTPRPGWSTPTRDYTYEHSYPILKNAGAGREAIYVCKAPNNGKDYMMSKNCSAEGYVNMGLAGYMWTSSGTNRLPYYRCRIDSGTFAGDHFMTTDVSECAASSITVENGGQPAGYLPQSF